MSPPSRGPPVQLPLRRRRFVVPALAASIVLVVIALFAAFRLVPEADVLAVGPPTTFTITTSTSATVLKSGGASLRFTPSPPLSAADVADKDLAIDASLAADGDAGAAAAVAVPPFSLSRGGLQRLLAAVAMPGESGGDSSSISGGGGDDGDGSRHRASSSSTPTTTTQFLQQHSLVVQRLVQTERAIVADITDATLRAEFNANPKKPPAVVCSVTIPTAANDNVAATSSSTRAAGADPARPSSRPPPPPSVVLAVVDGRVFALPEMAAQATAALRPAARYYRSSFLRAAIAGLAAVPPELVVARGADEEQSSRGTVGSNTTVASGGGPGAGAGAGLPPSRPPTSTYRPRRTCLYIYQRDEMVASLVLHRLLRRYPALLVLAGSVMTSPVRLRVAAGPGTEAAEEERVATFEKLPAPWHPSPLNRVRYSPDPRCDSSPTTSSPSPTCRVAVAVEAVPGRMPHPRILPIPDYHAISVQGSPKRYTKAEATAAAMQHLERLLLPLPMTTAIATEDTFPSSSVAAAGTSRSRSRSNSGSGGDGRGRVVPLLQYRGATTGFGPLAVAEQWEAPRPARFGFASSAGVRSSSGTSSSTSSGGASGGPLWDWAEKVLLAALGSPKPVAVLTLTTTSTNTNATTVTTSSSSLTSTPAPLSLATLVVGNAPPDPMLPGPHHYHDDLLYHRDHHPSPPQTFPTLHVKGFRYSDRCRAVASLRCGMERLQASNLVDRLNASLQSASFSPSLSSALHSHLQRLQTTVAGLFTPPAWDRDDNSKGIDHLLPFAVHARRFALNNSHSGHPCLAHEGHWHLGRRLRVLLREHTTATTATSVTSDSHAGSSLIARGPPMPPSPPTPVAFDVFLSNLVQHNVPHASLHGAFERAVPLTLFGQLRATWYWLEDVVPWLFTGRWPPREQPDERVRVRPQSAPGTTCEEHYAVLNSALEDTVRAMLAGGGGEATPQTRGNGGSPNNVNENKKRRDEKNTKTSSKKNKKRSTDFQLDIDGNSNSWDGLRWKLCSLKPTLKVRSSSGFVQWYYGSLRDGHNVALLPAAHRAAEDTRRHLTSRNASAWAAMAANARLLCQRAFAKGVPEYYVFDTVVRAWSHHVPAAAGYDPSAVLAAYIETIDTQNGSVDTPTTFDGSHRPQCRGNIAHGWDPRALRSFSTVNAIYDQWNNNLADTGCGRSYAIQSEG